MTRKFAALYYFFEREECRTIDGLLSSECCYQYQTKNVVTEEQNPSKESLYTIKKESDNTESNGVVTIHKLQCDVTIPVGSEVTSLILMT